MRRLRHPSMADVELATVLSALGDPVRLSIVRTLADGAEHVQADFVVDVGQSTLSHHMSTLRAAGVVFSRPEGTRCYISLRPELGTRFPGLLTAVLAAERARPCPIPEARW